MGCAGRPLGSDDATSNDRSCVIKLNSKIEIARNLKQHQECSKSQKCIDFVDISGSIAKQK